MNTPVPDSVFHPSFFEEPHVIPIEHRTLDNVRRERKYRLPNEGDLSKLSSPGMHNLTPVKHNTIHINGSVSSQMLANLQENSVLSTLFFSHKNIQNLQHLLRLVVYKESGYKVDNQSVQELLVIMRSIFLQYSKNPGNPPSSTSEQQKRKFFNLYKSEIHRLNQLVVNEAVPLIVSQTQQLIDYYRDASVPALPNELPKNVNIKGTRQYSQQIIGLPREYYLE